MSGLMKFKQVVDDIKSLKIQGAESVARESAKALLLTFEEHKQRSSQQLLHQIFHAQKVLLATRSTEPMMKNTLAFVLKDIPKKKEEIKKHLSQKIAFVVRHFLNSQQKIAELTANKIKNGMVVYTHCHSSTVVNALILAKKQGKRFVVHNTETRPLFQGRTTAIQLARHNIKVYHFIDSAMRLAIKKADIILLGSDAITSTKIYNKIGSEIVADYANSFQAPLYICTNSWKFNSAFYLRDEEEIEERLWKEVWKKKPKKVSVMNPAFEAVDPKKVTGIISEYGILSPDVFVEQMIEHGITLFSSTKK